MRRQILSCMIGWCILELAEAPGLMILYRPRDVSNECANSQNLRFDLSYGMGMSDTITLVFRTLALNDYECVVDIVPESELVVLIIVVQFPGHVKTNCAVNRDVITIIQGNHCYRLCDFLGDRYTTHVVFPVSGRLRFRYISNSSSNRELNAFLYQVTATAARPRPGRACTPRNETSCTVDGQHFCFTSGVVCDGIRNCGVADWFDERKPLCDQPIEKLGPVPVLAVASALLCFAVAAGRLLLRCLPSRADSFFIFNANEDNRLCIDAVLKPRTSVDPPSGDRAQRASSVFSSSSSSDEITLNNVEVLGESFMEVKTTKPPVDASEECVSGLQRGLMRSVAARIQETLRRVTRVRSRPLSVPHQAPMTTTDI